MKIKSKIFFKQKNSDYSYINSENKYSKSIKKIIKIKKIKSKLVNIKRSNCNFLLNKINNNYFKSKGNIENMAFAYQIAKKNKLGKIIV